MTGIRALDAEFGFDPGGPFAQHDDAGREQQSLFHVMGDEDRGKAGRLPQRYELGLQAQARKRVELAEWLIERQKARIVHQRTRERGALGHAARKLVRIGVCKAMQSDKIERGVDALLLLLENAARVEPGRNIVPDRRPRKSVGSWKTRMREGSGRSTSDPSAVMLPAVGCSRPEMSRSKVDLPQPDGPSKAMNSPADTAWHASRLVTSKW